MRSPHSYTVARQGRSARGWSKYAVHEMGRRHDAIVQIGIQGYRCARCHANRCGHVEAVMDYERMQEYHSMLLEGI